MANYVGGTEGKIAETQPTDGPFLPSRYWDGTKWVDGGSGGQGSSLPLPIYGQVAGPAVAATVPVAAQAAAAAAASPWEQFVRYFSDPKNIARTAGTAVPLFSGFAGGSATDGAFGEGSPLMGGITQDMDAARKRYQQAQPNYDALVNMAYGRTPTRYRGANAPSSYQAGGDAPPAGAYTYDAPRFG